MHIPVLKKEVLEHLDPKPNETFIDCTAGEGGHSLAILEKNGPKGKVLAIDQSAELLEKIRSKVKNTEYQNRLILVQDNFVNLKKIIEKENIGQINGILMDLGISSWHFEESKGGFTFLKDEKLDMRHGGKDQDGITAEEIINEWPENDIEEILTEYGEEHIARNIVREIVKTRKTRRIETTFELIKIIQQAVPRRYGRKKIHYATRTFQALRIAVNKELENLKKTLPQAQDILTVNGKLVVISFHSLEDRIVKIFFRDQAKKGLLKIITKKPITPDKKTELAHNPRARSAKLRTAIKI